MKPIICIIGATATGKTASALLVAKKLESSGHLSEIINTDSLLFYKELNIGTAKPTTAERSQIPHHLIDICSIKDPLNASDFEVLAKELIHKLHREKKIPILVGGSGFYVRALIKGMYSATKPSEEIVTKVLDMTHTDRRKLLLEKDPASYHSIHENDEYRTGRALEHIFSNDSLFSDLKEENLKNGPYDFSRPQDVQWNIHTINLHVEKEAHWKIIEKRAKGMIEEGLINEVQEILNQNFSQELAPLNSIGYKETIAFITGSDTTIQTKEELIERIYINTRRLAKSQKTFFNKVEPKFTYNPLEDAWEQLALHLASLPLGF